MLQQPFFFIMLRVKCSLTDAIVLHLESLCLPCFEHLLLLGMATLTYTLVSFKVKESFWSVHHSVTWCSWRPWPRKGTSEMNVSSRCFLTLSFFFLFSRNVVSR